MVRNPLAKRYLRDLRSDLGKYLVIFLLLLLSIAEISGYLVADGSMIAVYNESFGKYNVEDGNFIAEKQLSDRQREAIEALGVKVYDLQSTDRHFTNGTTIRIFRMRDQVDRACLMRGEFPSAKNEIAIDRMYADNNGISLGDELVMESTKGRPSAESSGESAASDGRVTYKVTGFVALSDYSTMFENNNDMMFDASLFCVGVVTAEDFSRFDKGLLDWRYAWKYDEAPKDKTEENDKSEEFLKGLTGIVNLKDYIPRYQNQAINFTGEDMGSDKAMMTIFLYIIIVVIAFVFGVTTSNTIIKESTVIGTLRATGYTRSEMLRHYMAMPAIVTVVAAIIGNILGYTVLKGVNAALYYGSYSLPAYETRWSADAFVKTTVIPMILMILINWWILRRKLKLSPIRFLRHDLVAGKSKNAPRLSPKIPFFARFRMRIALQNVGSYVILFVGVLFANLLLLFSLMFPSVLSNYMDSLPENMFCNYQYVLKLPAGAINEDNKLESMVNMLIFMNDVETENPTAEKFTAYSLHTEVVDGIKDEDILIYGVKKDSKYIDIDFKGDGVWVSSAYADKWMLEPGDEVHLKEIYGDETYTFRVDGIYDYTGGLLIIMDQKALNETFDLGEDTFSGYLSDTEITDIDEKYIGQVVDFESLSKTSRQLDISMGSMMRIVSVFALIMYMILVYLLSKTIIEKNAAAISMTKILGYTSREIGNLYVMVTTILVVIFIVVTIPLDVWLITLAFKVAIRMEMAGWIPFFLSGDVYIRMAVYGFVTYGIIALLEYKRIGRVPMEEALKNVE